MGVLRPAEGNWTGPAASLCGFGPTLVGVDPSGVGVCSNLVTPWKPSHPSPLMPLIVSPEQPLHRPDHHPVRRQCLASDAADRRSEQTVHRPDH